MMVTFKRVCIKAFFILLMKMFPKKNSKDKLIGELKVPFLMSKIKVSFYPFLSKIRHFLLNRAKFFRRFNFNWVKFGRKFTILAEFRSNIQCLSHFFRRKYILRKTWYFDRVSDKYFSVYFFVGTRLRFEPNWDFHPSEGRSDFSFRVAFDVSHRGVNLQRTSAAMNQCSLLFAWTADWNWTFFLSKFYRISLIFIGRTEYFWSKTYFIRSQSPPIRPIFLYEIKRRFCCWLHP